MVPATDLQGTGMAEAAVEQVDSVRGWNQDGCISEPSRLDMASITIKNIPDHLLARLREQAAMEQRSMNKEIIRLLDTALSAERAHPMEDRRKLATTQAAAWLRLRGRWVSDIPAEDEIAAIYSARSSGREIEL